MNSPILTIFLTAVLLLAAIQDIRFHKIPNVLTYPTILIAFFYHAVTSSLDGLLLSAGGLTLGMGIFIVPYFLGVMGAGDAKLMGAVGAIIGARGVFIASIFTALVGGIYALVILARNFQYARRQVTTLKTLVFTGQFIPIPAAQHEKESKLCYGVAIALGTLGYIFLELSGHNFLI